MIKCTHGRKSRIGVLFNGAPLFTGDAGSGESNIRKWLFEKDLIECIVALPENMFYNTGILTYIWILTNQKQTSRRGKIQLIDARDKHAPLRKNTGKKNRIMTEQQCANIVQMYSGSVESDTSKIFANKSFGYTKVVVEQPLNSETDLFAQSSCKPDPKKRDYERIPLGEDIDEYFKREVQPYLPDAWFDRSQDQVGYTINFNRHFYKQTQEQSFEELAEELNEINKQIAILSREVYGSLREI